MLNHLAEALNLEFIWLILNRDVQLWRSAKKNG